MDNSHRATAAEGSALTRLAVSATLHCLTGCAIGEVLGMVIGTALGWSDLQTVALAVGLAFLFGYAFTIGPVMRSGLPLRAAVPVALAADTVSITVMEIVDNAIMLLVPGPWTPVSARRCSGVLSGSRSPVAFVVTVPVNRWLIARGKGHAVVHQYHHADGHQGHGIPEDAAGVGPSRGAPSGTSPEESCMIQTLPACSSRSGALVTASPQARTADRSVAVERGSGSVSSVSACGPSRLDEREVLRAAHVVAGRTKVRGAIGCSARAGRCSPGDRAEVAPVVRLPRAGRVERAAAPRPIAELTADASMVGTRSAPVVLLVVGYLDVVEFYGYGDATHLVCRAPTRPTRDTSAGEVSLDSAAALQPGDVQG
jgi:hypothetical protein